MDQLGASYPFSLFWDASNQQWCYGDSDNYLHKIDFSINDKETVDLNVDFQLSHIMVSADNQFAAFGGDSGVTLRRFPNIYEAGSNLCRTALPVRDVSFSSDSSFM